MASGGTDSATVRWLSRRRPLIEPALVVLTVGAFAGGGIAWLVGWRDVADGCWIVGTLLAVVPALVWVLVALRRGRARRGPHRGACRWWARCSFGEYLAGALIAVMLASGRALDAAAAAPRLARSAGPAGAGATVRAATRRRRRSA